MLISKITCATSNQQSHDFNIPEDENNKFRKNKCEPHMSYIITREEILFMKSCLKIKNLSDALLSQ